jgi:protein brassinosteroid insensitive 2
MKSRGSTYRLDKILGSGTFGTVFSSINPCTGQKVAIKKLPQDLRYKNRELSLMKDLSHPNIMIFIDSFTSKGARDNENFLHIVMEYMPLNLLEIIHNYHGYKQRLPTSLVKIFSYQLLRSLLYLELKNVVHRDIKTENVMVEPISNRLVLCDFGCAKKLVVGESNISYICSRYYRPPELILGSTNYNCSVDMWSVGCVIAEMVLGKPLFAGKTQNDQLVEIIKVLGSISKEDIQEINPKFLEMRMPEIKKLSWRRVFSEHVEELDDLLDKIFVYSPSKRISPLQALQHPFFEDLRKEGFRMPGGRPLPGLFNWTSEELAAGVHLSLTPDWAKS